MDIVIANENKSILDEFNVATIDKLYGEFSSEEIVRRFKNLGYNRMIIDITAIKGYQNIDNLRKLSANLDPSKIILLLNKSEDKSKDTTSSSFLSKLVSIRIDNFTMDLRGLEYLYNNPNDYRDTVQYQNMTVLEQTKKPPIGLRPLNSNDNIVPMEIYDEYNSYEEVKKQRIIGIKSVTRHSGATTITKMIKDQLSENYSVVAIEVDRNDFKYFRDRSLISTTGDNIERIVKNNSEADVILIDINNSFNAEKLCDNVLYLIEPSTIKLNKLLAGNPNVLSFLKDKTVLLNLSLLSEKDVREFEIEANLDIYFNLPPINDRESSKVLNELLSKLGFEKQNVKNNVFRKYTG